MIRTEPLLNGKSCQTIAPTESGPPGIKYNSAAGTLCSMIARACTSYILRSAAAESALSACELAHASREPLIVDPAVDEPKSFYSRRIDISAKDQYSVFDVQVRLEIVSSPYLVQVGIRNDISWASPLRLV